jgi:Rad3-related DNA helicase
VFYHRKKGCSYYDQYLAYFDADVIIFNAAKYLSEISLGRKPLTEVDIIDEADDFLDGLFQQSEVNLTRFYSSLKSIVPESVKGQHGKEKVLELLELEEKNKKALGVNPDKVIAIKETKIKDIFDVLNTNSELEAEIALEELNYANKALEAARNFKGSLDEVYLTFRKEDDNLIASFVSTNLSAKFQELMDKSKALVFMSGTLHSESVLKNIFKIKDYKIIEAETLNFGSVEIIRTGKEFDCKYSNLKDRDNFRRKYLEALSFCLDKAIVPVLVHVHAYQDLPKEEEKIRMGITNVVSAERLMTLQNEDKTGMAISLFKQGLNECLFSTKCSRGVDFPGNVCNSIVFTKYPNPNYGEPFWKVLQMKHPEFFWDFYRDKARREFLQRIYRALRSKDDHVYILSPDTRVLDAVKEMQKVKTSLV